MHGRWPSLSRLGGKPSSAGVVSFPRGPACLHVVLLLAALTAFSCGSAHSQNTLNLEPLRQFLPAWMEAKQKGLYLPGAYVPEADRNGDGLVDYRDAIVVIEDALLGPARVNNNVRVLPADGSVTITPVSDTELRLTGAVPTLKTGDVITSAIGDGLLRKVASVTSQPGGGVLVSTEPACLADAITDGTFHGVIPPDPNAPIIWEPGVLPQQVSPQGLSAGINLSGIDLFGGSNSLARVFFVSGRLYYSPAVSVGGRIRGARLQEFHATATGEFAASLTIRLQNPDRSLTRKRERKLCQVPLGKAVVWIGYVPVVLCPRLEFYAGYEIGSSVAFPGIEKTFSTTVTATLGAEYHDGVWSPVSDYRRDSETIVRRLDLGGGLWAKVYFKTKLVVYIDAVVGPSLDGQVYGKAEFNVDLTKRTYDGRALLGLEVLFGINATILDRFTLSWSKKILGPYEWEFARLSGSLAPLEPPAPTVHLCVDDPYLVRGNSTYLRWTSTDAASVVSSNFGATQVNGALRISPTATTTYEIRVEGPGGEASDTATVVVGGPGPGPGEGPAVMIRVPGVGSYEPSYSQPVALSADGRYLVFCSFAYNLVPGDTNGCADVFVHDRVTRRTERVSVASSGQEGNGSSFHPAISADGRYVAFVSDATNLAPGDTNVAPDVFVHDRVTRRTERVSVASNGQEGNAWSDEVAISADGRYVAFWTVASNLVPGDTNRRGDVFVHDRLTGSTERVSVGSNGEEGNGDSIDPAISADGRYVAFVSHATNLAPGDTNVAPDVFVHDRVTRRTERVSVASNGEEGHGESIDPAISADGRYVAFVSYASNLAPGDTNKWTDVFVHDRATKETRLVTFSIYPADDWRAYLGGISGDGRYVAFSTTVEREFPPPTTWYDAHIWDRVTGLRERVNIAPDGAPGFNATCEAISADGRYVALRVAAGQPPYSDLNPQLYLRDRWPWLGGVSTSARMGTAPSPSPGYGASSLLARLFPIGSLR